MPIQIWEAWQVEEGHVMFSKVEHIKLHRAKGFMGDDSIFLHRVVAATGEEACAIHNEKMGWEPYRPVGEPEPCPNGCGGEYYPRGYGDCPNCGNIC